MNTRESLDHPIDNGYNCGASHVEKAILENLEKENESIQLFERKYPELRDYLMFVVRKFKEEVYTKPDERIRKTYNFEDFIDDEELEDERFKIAFMPGELNEILEKEGYIDSIRNALLDFKNNYIPGKQIYGVLLTGGASRMSFIKSLVCSCWDVDEDQVHYDIDPSLTISRGVAEVARMDMRTGGMETGLNEEIDKVKNSNAVYETFVEGFCQQYRETLTDYYKSRLELYATAKTDWSYQYLENLLGKASGEVSYAMREWMPELLRSAVETNLKKVQEKVEDIRKHYAQQGMNIDVSYKVELPKFSDQEMLDSIKTYIDNTITGESFGRALGTAGLAVGGGLLAAGLLSAIPGIGWIAGAGILASRLKNAESDEQRKTKPRNINERKARQKEILSTLDANMKNIEEMSKKKLLENQQMKAAVKDCVAKTLQSYRENLKAARLLID